MTEPQDVLAERIATLVAERDAAREEAGHEKAMRKSCGEERDRFIRKTMDLEAQLAAALVRTPETLDVERLANALDSVDIDEFDTLGAFDSTGYARAILAVLPFAATASPTPPEGLLTELAERHLDRRYPPPGHAAWREPELPASEWRAAYFVLARIALEQLDECRAALAASPAPDPGAGE